MPAAVTVERWTADRAVEQIRARDSRPYFGFVSFVGPHPPFAPPIPFNRMYDPDRMPNPVRGELRTDHMDEQIPWMNRLIWAEDINDSHARLLKARYYGEISYIDDCMGRILDAVDARADAADTLICFFADHGDHLGDHHAWQKESFFDAACHIPFLVSWPARLPGGVRRSELVCLTDLFGIATHAAGKPQPREGIDVLAMLQVGQAFQPDKAKSRAREHLIGYYGAPGTRDFKIMVRKDRWKYIFMANGGRQQLFDLRVDSNELVNLVDSRPETVAGLRATAVAACQSPGVRAALEGDGLRKFAFLARPAGRIYQFDRSRGITGFPAKPEDVLKPRP
jgi:arylsulfatase